MHRIVPHKRLNLIRNIQYPMQIFCPIPCFLTIIDYHRNDWQKSVFLSHMGKILILRHFLFIFVLLFQPFPLPVICVCIKIHYPYGHCIMHLVLVFYPYKGKLHAHSSFQYPKQIACRCNRFLPVSKFQNIRLFRIPLL